MYIYIYTDEVLLIQTTNSSQCLNILHLHIFLHICICVFFFLQLEFKQIHPKSACNRQPFFQPLHDHIWPPQIKSALAHHRNPINL